jgi:heme exporter protein B
MNHPIITLFKKDFLLEMRQQHTLYGLLLYIAATIFVLYLGIGDGMEANVWNGLFWVIQLFVCVNAVAKSFMQEGRGRMLYYFTIAHPAHYILAKLLYNTFLMMALSLLSLLLYALFLGSPFTHAAVFMGIVALGGCSISLVFSLMSAIAAKAGQNAALVAILGFPVILPLLLMLMQLSRTAFGEVFKAGAVAQLAGLIVGLDALVLLLSVILFPFLWKE